MYGHARIGPLSAGKRVPLRGSSMTRGRVSRRRYDRLLIARCVRAIIINVPHVFECVRSAVVGEPREYDYRATCTADHVSAFSPCTRLLFVVIFSRGSSCAPLPPPHNPVRFTAERKWRARRTLSRPVATTSRARQPLHVTYFRAYACVCECVIYLFAREWTSTRRRRLARPSISSSYFFQNDLKTYFSCCRALNVEESHCYPLSKFLILNQKENEIILCFLQNRLCLIQFCEIKMKIK